MTKFIKTLLSIAGGCLVLGIILSIVGLCLGGRLTSIRVGWDNGPRVYYTDAFTDGEFASWPAAVRCTRVVWLVWSLATYIASHTRI